MSRMLGGRTGLSVPLHAGVAHSGRYDLCRNRPSPMEPRLSKAIRQLVAFVRKPSSILLVAGITLLVLAINDVAQLATSIIGAVALSGWLVRRVLWLEHHLGVLRRESKAQQTAAAKQRQRVTRLAARTKTARAEASALGDEVRRVARRAGDLDIRIDRTRTQIAERKSTVDDAVSALRSEGQSLAADIDAVRHRANALERISGDLGVEVRRVWTEAQRTREIAVDSNRHLTSRLDALGEILRDDLGPVPVVGVDNPLLSIAIPSFNRPEALAHCLHSIVDQLDDSGRVEVWVTDDASPDVSASLAAHDFAVSHPQIGFVPLSENIGLERNLLTCLKPCRGRHVLILGNDDALLDGALATILADLEGTDLDVLLYEKTRFSSDLSEELAAVPGSTPIAIESGASHRFSTPFDVAADSGILSAFGFISQVVLRREPFLDVDPEPFFELTMYPQVAVLLAAFADSEVAYRNTPVVAHRTNRQAAKLVETIGRREESFMTGGDVKAANWFGPTLAAMLQRAADAGGYDTDRYRTLPEHLFSSMPLVEWIEHNVSLATDLQVEVGRAVRTDADRFLESVGSGDAAS